MIGKSDIKRAFDVELDISSKMVTELETWGKMYTNGAEWLTGGDSWKPGDTISLGLPAAIASEIARSATIEMKAKVTGSARADFLNEQLQRAIPILREQLEYGCAKGGLIIKPWVSDKELEFDFVQADQFYPLAFRQRQIISCVFADQRKIGDSYYTRLELHELGEAPGGKGKAVFIKNAAFKSSTKDDLGMRVSLEAVPEWKDLAPEAMLDKVDRPLFAYFRYPQANNIDPSSPLGVSCFARAKALIRNADEIYSNLVWEFYSGKRAIYADVDAFDKDTDGKPKLPDARLYRTLNASEVRNIGDGGKLFEDWSPDFRNAAIQGGLDTVLKKIEFNCGLAYGTLSDPETVDKTATEILSSKQRSAATVLDTQKALRTALDQLLYAMDKWATMSALAKKGAWEATYEFDDSLVSDKQQQWAQDTQAVGMLAMSKVEFRMRNYGESEEVARDKVAEAQAEMGSVELFPEDE